MIDIDIKDISGLTKFSTGINMGAKGKYTLMKEDYIILPFSVDDPVYFKLGDYVDMAGVLDDALGGKLAKIYELVDLYQPTYNQQTGGYDYQLKLDADYMKWKNKKFKFTPEHGGQEASWSLTATLDAHLDVFLRNLVALGYKNRGNAYTYSIDGTVISASKLITYNNTNMIDALTLMAETFGCEWWVDSSVIHFGRCEFGDAVELDIGKEIASMSRSNSKGTFATRVYAFGSTRNIPENYREVDESMVVNGVVQKRLMLPEGTPYIDAYPDMETEEAVEAIVVFDDIYPHRIGTMSNVTTFERTEDVEGEDGETTQETYTVYRYKDTGLNFSSEYILPNQELRITFQSGSLMGMDFGVTFNPDEKSPEEQLWEIVRNEDYGVMLPNDTLKPKDGDTYILYGYDIKMVSDTLIPEAEQELKERAEDFVERSKVDDGTYTATLDSDWVYDDTINRTFGLGQRVNLKNPAYFENGRVSRILGFEFNLDIPHDSQVYTIGESTAYSRFGEIEDKLNGVSFGGQSYVGVGGGSGSGGSGGFYIIRTNDSTPPSDDNVFSALRSLSTFLRKDRADSTRYLLSLLGGAITDNLQSQAFAAGPFGTGYLLKRDPSTGKSYLEIDELYVRLKAYFDTLEIKHLSHVGGRIVLSPAAMECNRVEIVDATYDYLFDSAGSQIYDSLNDEVMVPVGGGEQAYRCYFKQTDGEKEIVNEFAVDDLVQCREFNVKTNISHNVSNQYYWRRVINVGDDYIDLSMDDCDTGSMEPKAGDTIVTIGNKTDVNRQHVVFLSSYDDDAPCMKFYSGINSYSMLNKEVTVISPNADKNVFTGQVVIKPGSAGFGNLTDAPDMGVIEQEIQEAKDAAEDAKQDAADVQNSVADFTEYVNGAFSDGIITEAEAKAIATYINIVNNEKKSAESTYNELYNNSYLEGSAKVGLANAKSSLFSAIDALISSVNTAIADGKTTTAEKNDVDAKYATFNTRCAAFYEACEAANQSIQDKLKGYSDNAQKAADEANQAASNAMEDANDAKNSVNNLKNFTDSAFEDGIISRAEATAIAKYINTVNATKKEMDSTYTALYNNPYLTGTAKSSLYSAKNSFNSATTNLVNAINSAIADGKTTTSEKNTVDSRFTTFNNAYASLATAIGNANEAIQDKIKNEAIAESKKDLDSQIGGVTDKAKDDLAKQLGYANYEEMVYYAERNESPITGGHINTALIETDLLVTSAVLANAIKANTLNVNDKFKVFTDGSVDISGILHSLGNKTELIISNGYLRVMYNGSDVLLISVDERTGAPTINMNYDNKRFYVSPDQFTFRMSNGRMLTFDPDTINLSGQVMADPDGYLYVSTSQYNFITAYIYVSPTGGGTVLPFEGSAMKLEGSTDTLEAIPSDGYEFDHWSDGGSRIHDITWSGSSYSFTAYFKKKAATQYRLTLSASPSNGGTVSPTSGNTYEEGTSVRVSATPNSGWRFIRWSDGLGQSHNVTMNANKSLTAYFEKYTVTGDEIFSGTALTSSSYWNAYGNASISSVSGGVATIRFSSFSSNTYVMFNKGYLGSKLEQGHKYLLSFQIKSSVSNIALIVGFGPEVSDDFVSNDILYGEPVNTSYKTINLNFTADRRDSNSSDGLFIMPNGACTLSIKNITLKEV